MNGKPGSVKIKPNKAGLPNLKSYGRKSSYFKPFIPVEKEQSLKAEIVLSELLYTNNCTVYEYTIVHTIDLSIY